MQILFELDALTHARNYQRWMFEAVEPYLGTRILELGAGIGNMSQWLPQKDVLIVSELEPHYLAQLQKNPKLQGDRVKLVHLDLSKSMSSQLESSDLDTIVSFNVLEHIDDDFAALKDQVALLKASKSSGNKRIVIFVPAIQFAYGEFDRAFKHFRRYHATDLKKIFNEIDPAIQVTTRYFNLLSLLPWIIQGRVLKRSSFNSGDIQKLEKIIPFWRPIDFLLTKVLRIPLGQSLICVAEIK